MAEIGLWLWVIAMEGASMVVLFWFINSNLFDIKNEIEKRREDVEKIE
jgi:hypothetical protein